MFDLIYGGFFLLMVAEMGLFVFLNLPFPKSWKATISFEHSQRSKLSSAYQQLSSTLTFPAPNTQSPFKRKNSEIKILWAHVHLAKFRNEKIEAILRNNQTSKEQVRWLPCCIHLLSYHHIFLDKKQEDRPRASSPAIGRRTPCKNGLIRLLIKMLFLQSISNQHHSVITLSIMSLSDDYIFEDNEMLSYLLCKVCAKVFRNPIRIHRCGHTFCQACLPEKKMENKCPQCKSQIQAKQIDLTASNLIADLTVKCNARECPFQGTYEQYMSNHKNVCPIRKFGGIDIWLSQVRNSINTYKTSHKQGQVEEIQDSHVQEVLVQDENQIHQRSETNRTFESKQRRQNCMQKNYIQISNSDIPNEPEKATEPNRYIVVERARKPISLEKFIECIEVETNGVQKPEDQNSKTFVQSFFSPRRVQNRIKTEKQKSNIIQLQK